MIDTDFPAGIGPVDGGTDANTARVSAEQGPGVGPAESFPRIELPPPLRCGDLGEEGEPCGALAEFRWYGDRAVCALHDSIRRGEKIEQPYCDCCQEHLAIYAVQLRQLSPIDPCFIDAEVVLCEDCAPFEALHALHLRSTREEQGI